MRVEHIAFAAAALAAVAGASAALYRWVDEKGVIQYSDRPPDNKAKSGVEMSKRGLVLKKLDTPLPPDQQKAKDEEDARRKADEQQALAQRRADSALLQSFSSVQEIDLKRDRELQMLESTLGTLRNQERSLTERLSDDRMRLDGYAKRGKPAPASITEDMKRSEAELKRLRAGIEKRVQEMAATRTHYDAMRSRYLELRQQEASTATATPASATVPLPSKK
jgi:hypothetical protein